ncbi:MAG: hypothetical protein RLZZ148_1116, partial [Cyanobacteriota bacterium]
MSFPTTSSPAAFPQTNQPWHTLTVAEALEQLDSDPSQGLAAENINQRQQYFGAN